MHASAIKKGCYYLIPGLVFAIILAYVGRFGFLYAGADLQFHANRIVEFYNNLRQGNLIPVISTFSANQIGSIVPTMYPSFPVYIGAVLQFIFPPVTAMYVLMWVQLMTQFSIAKWVSKELGLSLTESTTAAFIYTMAVPTLSQVIQQWLFGEVWAMSFMPLVILGLIRLTKTTTNNLVALDKKTILLLVIGFTFIILSHVLSFAIVVGYTAIFTLFLLIFRKNRLNVLANLSVAAVITVLLSLIFLLPFIIAMLGNTMVTPAATELSIWAAPDWHEFIKSTFAIAGDARFKTNTVGIIAFLAIFGVLVTWRKQDRFTKVATLVSVGVIFSGTSYVWKYLYGTKLGVIQFPHRVFIIAIFLLSLSAILAVRHVINKNWLRNTIYVVLALFSFGVAVFNVKYGFVDRVNAFAVQTNYKSTAKHPVSYTPMANFKVHNEDFKNLMGYWVTYGAFDYLPKNVDFNQSLQKKEIVQDDKLLKTKATSVPNGMVYRAKFAKNTTTVIPMVGYKSLKYEVTDQNKHQYQYKINKNKQLVIKTTAAQVNRLTVRAKTPATTYIAWIISLATGVCLIIFGVRDKRKTI